MIISDRINELYATADAALERRDAAKLREVADTLYQIFYYLCELQDYGAAAVQCAAEEIYEIANELQKEA